MVDGGSEMGGGKGDQRQRGFTLVELLLAIFIFAIVISSVYGAYRFSFSIIHGSEARLLISRNARVAMERIAADLDGIVAGPGGLLEGERHDHSGKRGDSLAFVSSAHLVLSKADAIGGYTLIRYSVERDEGKGFLNLYRSDTVLFPGAAEEGNEARQDILCQGLKEVAFTYRDEDGTEKEEWQSDEGSKAAKKEEQQQGPLLPALVYVKLTFAESPDSEGETIFRTAVALPQKAESGQ
jgi:general secretion pathway protein J